MSVVPAVARGNTIRFAVRVQPRASRNECTGVHDGAVRIRIQAPPVDGAANDALVDFIARALNVPSRRVHIVGGVAARLKTVEVEGITREQLNRLVTVSPTSSDSFP
jgi:hypothetical protein